MNSDPVSKHVGFTTASGKAVLISEESLKEARLRMEATDEDPYALLEFNEESGATIQTKVEGEKGTLGLLDFSGGFSTAKGGKIHVSEEALEKARSSFDEPNDVLQSNPETFTRGFMTASGNLVKVSEKSLKEARAKLDDSSSELPEKMMGGFLASSNAKKLSPELVNEARSVRDEVSLGPQNFVGSLFSTASGKNLTVSAEALSRAKSILEEVTHEDQDSSEVKDISFREDFQQPLKSSTPNPADVIIAKHRPKSKGFVTPFKKTGVMAEAKSALSNNSTNFTTPVLSDRRLSHLKGSNTGPIKTLGTRLGKFTPPLRNPIVRTVESLKRTRGSVDDLRSNRSKSPKLNSNRSTSSIADENVPASLNESSVSTVITPANISVTESQEILYSSKALLDDGDDFDMMETDEILLSESEPRPESFMNIVVDKKPVPHLRAWVARVYPIVFMCKTADGKIEYHSETSYEKLVNTKESRKSKEMEQLFVQVEEEHRKARAAASPSVSLRVFKKDNLNNMNVDDLLQIIESGDDFANIQALLSDSKLSRLREAQERKREEVFREIQKEVEIRFKKLCIGFVSVSPVLRIRLCDLSLPTSCETGKSKLNAVLSFWRPCEDLRTNLTECIAIDIFSVSPSQNYDDIKLNSTRETRVQPYNLDGKSREKLRPLSRRCYSFDEVINEEFSPPFREFDIVGLVVQIEDATNQMGETVYLSDGDENIISIKFWRTLSDEGLENVLQVGNMVSASNVQWRQSSLTGVVRAGYCQDITRFSLQPKEPYLQESLSNLKKAIQDAEDCISNCSRKIQLILNGEVIDTPKTPPLVRRIRPHVFEPGRKKLTGDAKFV